MGSGILCRKANSHHKPIFDRHAANDTAVLHELSTQQKKTRRDIAGYQIIRSKRADPSHFEDPHGLVHGFAVHDNRLSTCAVIYQH